MIFIVIIFHDKYGFFTTRFCKCRKNRFTEKLNENRSSSSLKAETVKIDYLLG